MGKDNHVNCRLWITVNRRAALPLPDGSKGIVSGACRQDCFTFWVKLSCLMPLMANSRYARASARAAQWRQAAAVTAFACFHKDVKHYG